MLSKIIMPVMACAGFFCATAQDSTSAAKKDSLKITGSADVYYRYNFHNPKSAPYNNFTSFSNSQNSFELGMASIKAEQSLGKAGIVLDLGFGKRAEDFSYNDQNTRFALKQLYLTYAPVSKVKLTIGSWATHIGYELVDAYLNRNYSMSYMFSYGPFFHTGLKADITVGEKSAVMIGVANPADLKSAAGFPKSIIGQFSTSSKNGKLKAWLNYQGGKYHDSARLQQADVVLTYLLTPKLNIGYNGTVQTRSGKTSGKWNSSEKWWGSAIYINADPWANTGFTLRGEYFNDEKGVIGFNDKILAATLSANFRISGLTIIPEFRVDSGSESPGLFLKENGTATKSSAGFTLAAVYTFSK